MQPRSVEESLCDRAVGVDAAVAEEGPVAAGLFHGGGGRISAMRISSVSRPARARMRPKGSAMKEPPQNSMPPAAGAFVADAVDGGDEDAVG